MSKIILLSCVSQKKNVKCKAKDLYVSSLFCKAYKYAQKLNPDKIYILSAKYHLLELDDEIEPYNLTLNDMSEVEKKEDLSKKKQFIKGLKEVLAYLFS